MKQNDIDAYEIVRKKKSIFEIIRKGESITKR